MHKKRIFVIPLALCAAIALAGCAATSNQADSREDGTAWRPREDTERTRRAQTTYAELFGDTTAPINETNPEYADIINNFIYGDVHHQSDLLDARERELIALVSLTTHQSYELLRQHALGALNTGLAAEEVLEAVYHCTPYVGVAVAYEAVTEVTETFVEHGVALPTAGQTQVADDERFLGGNDAQVTLFGDGMRRSAEETDDGVSRYVIEWCFGDFYTRGAIDLETREMLTMCILANMGVQQFGAHVRGTFDAGFSQEKIVAAITQCMPYMGTPRALNAISTVNQVLSPNDRPEPGNGPGGASGGAPIQNP
jgi:4-carboxymuconolactone decarboxylase